VGGHLWGEIDPRLMKVASVFGGGVAGTREELCGVLSAAAMIIGLLYGRTGPGEDEQISRTLIPRYRERLIAEFGTTQCRPLRVRFRGPDENAGTCAPLVEKATLMLLELLDEQGPQGR